MCLQHFSPSSLASFFSPSLSLLLFFFSLLGLPPLLLSFPPPLPLLRPASALSLSLPRLLPPRTRPRQREGERQRGRKRGQPKPHTPRKRDMSQAKGNFREDSSLSSLKRPTLLLPSLTITPPPFFFLSLPNTLSLFLLPLTLSPHKRPRERALPAHRAWGPTRDKDEQQAEKKRYEQKKRF